MLGAAQESDFNNIILQKRDNKQSIAMLGNNRWDTQEVVMAREDGCVAEDDGGDEFGLGDGNGVKSGAKRSAIVDTRDATARSNVTPKAENQQHRGVAVDVREFRSALPQILHSGGLRLAPVTLIVGDFVLTPDICVERKSLSDLLGSFTSGRLFTQMEVSE